MAAPKLPDRGPNPPDMKREMNSENTFHPERPLVYQPIKNEVRAYVWVEIWNSMIS